jgi:hypothetical protein
VATVATSVLVFAFQRELRLFVMIEVRAFPTLGGMTLLALDAIFAAVDIVETVTVNTQNWCVLVLPLNVAEITAHFLVLAGQFVLGFTMVEAGLAPFFFAVALVALLAEFFLMDILLFVARITTAFGIAIGFVGHMASPAGGFDMSTLEGIVGIAVIEKVLVELHHISIAAQVITVALLAFDVMDLVCQAVKAALVFDIGGDLLVTV